MRPRLKRESERRLRQTQTRDRKHVTQTRDTNMIHKTRDTKHVIQMAISKNAAELIKRMRDRVTRQETDVKTSIQKQN